MQKNKGKMFEGKAKRHFFTSIIHETPDWNIIYG